MELTTAISNDWGTPFELFTFAEYVYGEFDLDAAAEHDWKMCSEYIDKDMNALNPETKWNGKNIWINPPYNVKSITKFVNRAIEESKSNKSITMLLPVKSDQEWFHNLLNSGVEILFIKKRLKFRRRNGLPAIGASFPCMLVNIQKFYGKTHILSYDVMFEDFKLELQRHNERISEIIREEIDKEILKDLLKIF